MLGEGVADFSLEGGAEGDLGGELRASSNTSAPSGTSIWMA